MDTINTQELNQEIENILCPPSQDIPTGPEIPLKISAPTKQKDRESKHSRTISSDVPQFIVRKGFRYILRDAGVKKKNLFVYRGEDAKRLRGKGTYKIQHKHGKVKEMMTKPHDAYQNYHSFVVQKNFNPVSSWNYETTKATQYKMKKAGLSLKSENESNKVKAETDCLPILKMHMEPPKSYKVKDPFINIHEGDKENINNQLFDYLFKDGEDNSKINDEDIFKPKEVLEEQLPEVILTDTNYREPDNIRLANGSAFGRKTQTIDIEGEEGDRTVDLVYLMSEHMIKVLLQNTTHAQIFTVGTHRVENLDTSLSNEDTKVNILNFMIFDKDTSSFLPVLFVAVLGPVLSEVIKGVIGFMKQQFPNSFKPAKFIMKVNHSMGQGCGSKYNREYFQRIYHMSEKFKKIPTKFQLRVM